jgi:tetratricopeptide (TPR) repeat protein
MSAQEWAAKAQKLQSEQKYAAAADAYDKVLEFAPNIAEVYLNKGVVLSMDERYSEALQCFDKAIELKPELAGAHFNRANIYKTLSQSKNAAAAYGEALKLDPTNQGGWFGLSHALNELDDFTGALEAANKAIELSKTVHIPSHNERVFALLKLNRGAEAVKDIDIITKETPVDKLEPRARKLYAIVLSTAAIEATQAGKHAEALPYHERAAQADPSFQNQFNFAISLLQNEKQDEALKVLQKAKAVDANNWKVHAAIGTICMQKQNYEGAAEAFTEAAKFPETKEDETVNFNLGVALMHIGKEKEAKGPLEKVVKVNRNNWTAQALLGTIYIGEENFKMAENVLTVAAGLAGGSTDTSVLYNLGYAQLMNNKADDALQNFQKSATTDPENQQAKAAVEAMTASPEEVKQSVKNGLMSQMDESVKPTDGELKELDSVTDPTERAKILIAPQRPHYLRRKSMEGIVIGRVFELKTKFDAMAIKELKKN